MDLFIGTNTKSTRWARIHSSVSGGQVQLKFGNIVGVDITGRLHVGSGTVKFLTIVAAVVVRLAKVVHDKCAARLIVRLQRVSYDVHYVRLVDEQIRHISKDDDHERVPQPRGRTLLSCQPTWTGNLSWLKIETEKKIRGFVHMKLPGTLMGSLLSHMHTYLCLLNGYIYWKNCIHTAQYWH